jgi:putative intracellular protease/amidase
MEAASQFRRQVDVASSEKGPVTIHLAPGVAGPDVQRTLAEVTAADYDAIIFTGFNTDEFTARGITFKDARRLIDEFKSNGKLVTAICRGQQVLALHGELKGKKVAPYAYVDPKAYGPNQEFGGKVEPDGQVITAGAAEDAWDFVAKIVEALNAR